MIYYLQSALAYLFPIGIIFAIWRLLTLRSLKQQNINFSLFHELGLWGFSTYLVIVFSQTISPVFGFSAMPTGRVNLIPFSSLSHMITRSLYSGDLEWAILNIAGNILMFIPLGFCLPLLWQKFRKGFPTLLFGLAVSSFIEIAQLFLIRGTDIDDLFLNGLGTLFGFLCYLILQRILPTLCQLTRYKTDSKNRVPFEWYEIKSNFLLIILSVLICGFTANMLSSQVHPYSLIEGENAVLMNLETNQILYQKNSRTRIYPASTTKLITALTVLTYCKPDEEVIVGEEINFIAPDASTAGLSIGNQLTIQMLLEALLLPSGNDAAYTLAAYTGHKIASQPLSTEDAVGLFIDKMNQTASSLGAKNSYFLSPDGYDQKGQYSTAYDLALIGKACMENKTIQSIVSKPRITEVLLDGSTLTWTNSNQLLIPTSPYYYPGTLGLKTGTTDLAGNCLISAIEANHTTYLCVVMQSTPTGRWLDTTSLFELATEGLS